MKNFFKISLMLLISFGGYAQISANKNYLESIKKRSVLILKNAQKFKGDKYKISVENTEKTKVFVTREALYTEPDKQIGRPMPNGNCNVFGVNYKASYADFSLFFPTTNVKTKIYPGALYKFDEIKSLTLTPYSHNSKRNPLSLNTEIFTANGNSSNSTKLQSFDFSTVNNAWNTLLASKISGSTGADIYTHLTIVESKEQLARELETINNVSVGVELNIPIPNLPVTVSPSLAVSTTNSSQLKSSIQNEKSYAILRVEQAFYSSMLTPIENPEGGVYPVFQDSKAIPEDLMIISGVTYGRVFYIIISSTLSKGDLFKAIQSKVTVDAAVGVAGTGLPIGGKVKTTVTNEEKSKYQRAWDNKEIEITSKQWGGRAIELTDPARFNLSQALKEINSGNTFSKTNIGNPIRYTLQFAKDYANAFVNVDTRYATHNCGNSYDGKFDVDVTFKELYCKKTSLGSPDVYGRVDMTNISCTKCEKKYDSEFNFWKRKNEDQAVEFDKGDRKSYNVTKSFKGLSYEEIETLKFKLKARLKESDIGPDDKFESNKIYEFSVHNGDPGKTTLDDISKLQPNEKYVLNKEITCKEDGNNNSSTIIVKIDIKITAR